MQSSLKDFESARRIPLTNVGSGKAVKPDTATARTTCPCCGTVIEAKIPIVDLNTNTLSWRGLVVKLRPQAAEILYVMAGKFPHVVSREALIGALWAPDAAPDSTKGIDVRIHDLRQALRGTGIGVETVRDCGYRMTIA